jgi:hypothetical protein
MNRHRRGHRCRDESMTRQQHDALMRWGQAIWRKGMTIELTQQKIRALGRLADVEADLIGVLAKELSRRHSTRRGPT